MGWLASLFGLGGKVLDRILPDRAKFQEKNLDINAETERTSGGRMTPRKLLMYVCVWLFVWEVAARPVIVTYWPELPLPPSMLREVMLSMSSLFGLGF